MNMNTHGIQAKIICCVASVGAGFSFCCRNIEMPSSSGRMPINISAIIDPASGTPQGSRPNRLKIDVGSGALRSWKGPKKGACRSSMVTKITL